MMTVKELKEKLEKFDDDMPVWVYESTDENEPYQEIDTIEQTEFGEVTIYRK